MTTPTEPARGHRGLPHTADIRLQAWAPTREACLAEAVAALVDSFADTTGAHPERIVEAAVAADTDDERLAAVLDEVIYLLDTQNAVPLDLEVDTGTDVLRMHMPVTTARAIDLTGAAPKAVTLSGLRLTRTDEHWQATATIDV